MRRSLGSTSLTFVAVLIILLSACGGGSDGREPEEAGSPSAKANGIAEMKPPQALRAAIKAHRKAEDVVYKGRMLEGFGTVLHAADATISATARDCEFKLSSGHLGTATMRIVKGILYTRGSEQAMSEIFDLPASAFDILGDRWLSEPADEDFQCGVVESLTDDVDIAACLPGAEGEVDGTPTITVRCQWHSGEFRFHIATTGSPLVMWLEQVSTSGYDLKLVAADSGLRITEPPARNVVDTTALQ